MFHQPLICLQFALIVLFDGLQCLGNRHNSLQGAFLRNTLGHAQLYLHEFAGCVGR